MTNGQCDFDNFTCPDNDTCVIANWECYGIEDRAINIESSTGDITIVNSTLSCDNSGVRDCSQLYVSVKGSGKNLNVVNSTLRFSIIYLESSNQINIDTDSQLNGTGTGFAQG